MQICLIVFSESASPVKSKRTFKKTFLSSRITISLMLLLWDLIVAVQMSINEISWCWIVIVYIPAMRLLRLGAAKAQLPAILANIWLLLETAKTHCSSCLVFRKMWLVPQLALLTCALYHHFPVIRKLINGLTGGNSGFNALAQPGGGMTRTSSHNACANHAVNVTLCITCRNDVTEVQTWLTPRHAFFFLQEVRSRQLSHPKQNKATHTRLIFLIDEVSKKDGHFCVTLTLQTSLSLLLLVCEIEQNQSVKVNME